MGVEKLRMYVVISVAMATFVTLGLVILMNYGLNLPLINLCANIVTIYLVFGNMILLYNLLYMVGQKNNDSQKE